MHMADALISPAVGGVMWAVSGGAVALSAAKIKQDLYSDKKIPLMAVSGAFVFAAQMINFTIPLTGSSGHIGGGIMLAALLGAPAAFIALTAVLVIQALFFADGGLLALGCNIFNMGVIPCLIVYPLLFKPFVKRKPNLLRVAAVAAAAAGLPLGASCVVAETLASGITALPPRTFVLLMLPVHLAIGVAEGVITAAVLSFVHKVRPEIIDENIYDTPRQKSGTRKTVITALAIGAVVTGGFVSWFASKNPDGLEWAVQNITGQTELKSGEVQKKAEAIQEQAAIMPGYEFKDKNGHKGGNAATSVAGITGAVLTAALAGGSGLVIHLVKKRKKRTAMKREN